MAKMGLRVAEHSALSAALLVRLLLRHDYDFRAYTLVAIVYLVPARMLCVYCSFRHMICCLAMVSWISVVDAWLGYLCDG